MIRGDGYLRAYSYRGREPRRFRLALADREALDRAAQYLASLGAATTEFQFAAAVGNRRSVRAIHAQRRSTVDLVGELIQWPHMPSPSWIKGFLAGIFDAEGSCSAHILRISNTNPEIIAWIKACLGRLQFDYVAEPTSLANGLTYIRLLGGLPERMRFFLGTDPAISRKRTIDAIAVKNAAKLRVESIKPLGMVMRMYDITTGTGDFIANGVISHNCFARPTHEYIGFNAGRDFEREIVVKVNAPEVLRTELARRSWKREHIAMGTNTDPYQWVEGRYRLMEGIWEALRDAENECSILTKSPLLLRDLRLMLEVAQRARITACLSIPTLDEKAWRATEPHTPNPRARLEAVAELNRAGIPTGVLIAPLMPGINDAPRQLEPLLDAAEEAGATSIGGVALHLRGEVRRVFMDWLEADRPDLVPRYERLYSGRAYAPERERKRLAAIVRRGKPPNPFSFSDSTPARWRPSAAKHASDRDAPVEEPMQRRAAQATLF
jgi:DNA repair photolyase